MANFQHKCNVCWKPLEGQCFRTSCFHLFCHRDAYQHFGKSLVCPACDHDLSDSRSISEIYIASNGEANPRNLEGIWTEVLSNPARVQEELQMALNLHHIQEEARLNDAMSRAANEFSQQEQKMGERYMELRTFAEGLETKNNSLAKDHAYKETQLQELQAAYKEKMRKCMNLENLYSALKQQQNQQSHKSPMMQQMALSRSPKPQQQQGRDCSMVTSPSSTSSVHQQRRHGGTTSTNMMMMRNNGPTMPSSASASPSPLSSNNNSAFGDSFPSAGGGGSTGGSRGVGGGGGAPFSSIRRPMSRATRRTGSGDHQRKGLFPPNNSSNQHGHQSMTPAPLGGGSLLRRPNTPHRKVGGRSSFSSQQQQSSSSSSAWQ